MDTIHLEDPPNSGLQACCGYPIDYSIYNNSGPFELCHGCQLIYKRATHAS